LTFSVKCSNLINIQEGVVNTKGTIKSILLVSAKMAAERLIVDSQFGAVMKAIDEYEIREKAKFVKTS